MCVRKVNRYPGLSSRLVLSLFSFLEDIGVQMTATQFGFKTTWGHNLSLTQVMNIANNGTPVIVSFPPDRYAGGHVVVMTGENGNYVYLADSSLWNRHSLSRAQF